ncbi:MAG TPA: M28 family peptidase [Gemmataceae bacterium]|nr:M28 family peptidase [Gemmataceae bacterium]
MMRLVASLAVLVVVSLGIVFMFQPKAQPASSEPSDQETFAADRDDGFDAGKAMDYLKTICKLGPRISGSKAMHKQQELLKKHFEDCGAKVTLQRFTARQRSQKDPINMANLIVSWHPELTRRVLLCTHYDTRPLADQEPDHSRWKDGFLGANDGASGVGLLMELGNHMKDLPTKVGVDFVFLDGEEYIFDPREGGDRYCLGSEYFGEQYMRTQPKSRYIAGVLLDMVGGKGASFQIEQNSWRAAGPLVQDLWRIAAAEKCTAFDGHLGGEVLDDHVFLNRARIPTADIIDSNYFKTHWHRLSDVPENCSTSTLSQVARVLIVWLKRVR